MEQSEAQTIGQAKKDKHVRFLKRYCLAWMLLPLLILTQCGTLQQQAAQPRTTPSPLSTVYLADQAGVDVFQIPDERHIWQFHPNTLSTDDGKFAVGQGHVYLATDRLYALNIQTGQQDWETTFDQPTSALAVSDNLVYVASAGDVYAFNAHDGSSLWRQSIATGWSAITTLLLSNGLLSVSRGAGLVALDPLTGRSHWHFDLASSGDHIIQLLPLSTHSLLVQSGVELDALDEQTGHILWHQDIQIETLKIIGKTLYTIFSDFSSPSSNTSSVLSGLRAVDIESGKLLWQINTPIYGGLAAIGNTALYWAKGHDVTAWSTLNGAQLWHISATDTYQSLAVLEDTLITENSHGNLNALAATSGHLLWQQPSPTGSPLELQTVQNFLCGLDKAGTVIGLSSDNGTPLWYLVAGTSIHQLIINH